VAAGAERRPWRGIEDADLSWVFSQIDQVLQMPTMAWRAP
jgi:hypothetical protein